MTFVVFSGSTLPHVEAQKLLDADYRPPAAQGDLYRAARRKPTAIGLIDGYFEHVPAVWHKEILWALSQGIWVFGAASMGALRAAELARYGMIGVGRIYEQFASGTLEDDDEVAVAEAVTPRGPMAVSVALVDIRATLDAACKARVLDGAQTAVLIDIAKSTFYPERSYERLLADAENNGFDGSCLAKLRTWLPQSCVAQKRLDAVTLLQQMGTDQRVRSPFRARFHFTRTDMWHQLESSWRFPGSADAAAVVAPNDVIDEACLTEPALLQESARLALVRALASEVASLEGMSECAETVEAAALCFRRANGLSSEESLERWLADRHLQPEEFLALMVEEARLGRLRSLLAEEEQEQLVKVLRLSRHWPALRERAQRKAALLTHHGLTEPDRHDPRLSLKAAAQETGVTSSREGEDSDARDRRILREAWFKRMDDRETST